MSAVVYQNGMANQLVCNYIMSTEIHEIIHLATCRYFVQIVIRKQIIMAARMLLKHINKNQRVRQLVDGMFRVHVVAGSSPATLTIAYVAQLVEQRFSNP